MNCVERAAKYSKFSQMEGLCSLFRRRAVTGAMDFHALVTFSE